MTPEQSTDMHDDAPFLELVEPVRTLTMISEMNLYAAFNAVRHVVRAGVPGDIVECGVWKGGASALMASTLLRFEAPRRSVWLYDTFTGMTTPSDADVRHDGAAAAPIWTELAQADGTSSWAMSPRERVEATMAATGYPPEMVRLVEGKVEETIPSAAPGKIAVLRLDTDWYESTRHELVHLWPRLSVGGVLIVDDYGWWRGSRRAVDEFFSAQPVLLNRIDGAGARLAVKLGPTRRRLRRRTRGSGQA